LAYVPGSQPGRDPEAYAVRAYQQFADGESQPATARSLGYLGGTGLILIPCERSAQEARHSVLGDQPAELLRGHGHQSHIASGHTLRQRAVRPDLSRDERRRRTTEDAGEHGISAQWKVLIG
jgi:hypothetical protein